MKPLVTDELWAVVAPLLPRRRAQPKGGRPWVGDRATLNGVLYVLRTGIAWRHLPTELGWARASPAGGGSGSGSAGACGSGCTAPCSTGWRRPTGSTGRGRPCTAGAFPRKGGSRDRPQPDRQGQGGQQAPRPHGPPRHPARGRGDRGERARQPHAGAPARRGGARAYGPARPPAAPAREAARGQGLRLPAVPGRVRRPGRAAPDRPQGHAPSSASTTYNGCELQ